MDDLEGLYQQFIHALDLSARAARQYRRRKVALVWVRVPYRDRFGPGRLPDLISLISEENVRIVITETARGERVQAQMCESESIWFLLHRNWGGGHVQACGQRLNSPSLKLAYPKNDRIGQLSKSMFLVNLGNF